MNPWRSLKNRWSLTLSFENEKKYRINVNKKKKNLVNRVEWLSYLNFIVTETKQITS